MMNSKDFHDFFDKDKVEGGVSQKWSLKYQLLIDNIYGAGRCKSPRLVDKDPNPIPIKDV